jgi:hypothetical protein
MLTILKKKTFALYDNLIESIKKLEDPHLEFYLFQRTAKFCRIGHLYRTLPPEQGAFLREGYLKRNQDFLEYLTRGRLSQLSLDQMCLKASLRWSWPTSSRDLSQSGLCCIFDSMPQMDILDMRSSNIWISNR